MTKWLSLSSVLGCPLHVWPTRTLGPLDGNAETEEGGVGIDSQPLGKAQEDLRENEEETD